MITKKSGNELLVFLRQEDRRTFPWEHSKFVRHQAQVAVLGGVPLAPPARAGVRVNPSPRTAKEATHLQTFSAPFSFDFYMT
jgi:hypothetical protein